MDKILHNLVYSALIIFGTAFALIWFSLNFSTLKGKFFHHHPKS
jgi:hypothetical protein